MAKNKQKYYVVWQGKKPGLYDNWENCKQQVHGVEGAQYKAFETLTDAQQAMSLPYSAFVTQTSGMQKATISGCLTVDENGMTKIKEGIVNPPILDSIAVDAACSGNPGVMEYQGIYIATRTRLFHFKADKGTNNIGEFLAIVHGLSYCKKHHLDKAIYSDSANAINWVKQKICKSKLPVDASTVDLWNYIHRAEKWLRVNDYTTEIRKWETERWGEIPADFGRK